MRTGSAATVIGVDGLDYDVVMQLGPGLLPHLHPLVAASEPHSGTFPPDSVPSWTSILTGVPPEEHGQLHSVNFLLDEEVKVEASVERYREQCFWEIGAQARVAVLNPFLAYPPWAPNTTGAMVSGPSFAEATPLIADPNHLLVGEPPARMGGFARIPKQTEMERFVDETLLVAEEQFDYALRQLEAGRWDVFFHTNLTVDRIQHFAWRHFDPTDPTHPGSELAHLVPLAYQQLDRFVGACRALSGDDDAIAIVSDHGHGQRASVGVNFNELFRREGLLLLENTTALRRSVETAKTAFMWSAAFCHLEDEAVWVARRLPGKSSLKSGEVAGKPSQSAVRVPDIGGSNPFGGIKIGDDRVLDRVYEIMQSLEYKGEKVVEWCVPAEEILPTGANDLGTYPDLLFQLDHKFGPTWNMYGPLFMPIITHKRLSGGHTRRAVAATSPGIALQSDSSTGVNEMLRRLCAGS
jgi:predicted AlkP superfamily phosphohydrolase/phosphomutase